MALIKCKELSLGYDGKAVISNLNFELNQGDYLCIFGENGSGKSTLMKTILGLLKPLSGSIEYGEGLKECEIGYLPQQTEHQKDFPASVAEVVLSGRQAKLGKRPFYSKSDKESTKKNMELMKIADLADRCYRELSGGQQQRVLLARALCAAEKLILLDEPVTGLDVNASMEMYSLIRELNRSGMAVIMISHNPEDALKEATHVLKLGEKPFYGTVSQYKEVQ